MPNRTVVAVLIGSLLATAPTAGVAPEPLPEAVRIDVVSVNGSGCPVGTTSVAMEPHDSALTITYGSFVAQIGPGTRPTDARRTCQVRLNVRGPSGFAFALTGSGYRGTASLAESATVTQRTTHHVAGSPGTTPAPRRLTGPYLGDYLADEPVDAAALAFTRCGAAHLMVVNTDLQVHPGASDPTTTTSVVSIDKSTGYSLAWRRCAAA